MRLGEREEGSSEIRGEGEGRREVVRLGEREEGGSEIRGGRWIKGEGDIEIRGDGGETEGEVVR